jgi:Zn-dependent metalloprotease
MRHGNRILRVTALVAAAAVMTAGRAAVAQRGQDDGLDRRWEFGVLAEPPGAVSEEAARQFLVESGARFGFAGDATDLVLVRDVPSPIGRHFVFEQRFEGLPVYGAEVRVHYDTKGRVIGANSSYTADLVLEATDAAVPVSRALEAIAAVGPVPSRKRAVDAATRAERLRTSLLSARSSLVVFLLAGRAHLAWQVTAPGFPESWEAFVDARSGEVLRPARDVNRYVNGTGRVFSVNAVVATHDNSLQDQNDAASAVPESAYSIVTLPGLDGSGFLDGQFASSQKTKKRAFDAGNSFLFDRSADGFSETEGYYAFDYAERYIQSLGFTNVNNRQQVFSVNRFKQDNSFYSPQTKEITLGLGGVDDAEDAEVIWHEYGHSIQDDEVPGFGSTAEAGAMGEGFGDYWAGSVGARLSGGFQDTCIAEWDATFYSSTVPPCLRRLDGTKHYPEDLAGEVHDDGEIWSAALWQIREAIGAVKSDTLVLQHHFLLSPGASFNEAANALVTAATALGYRSSEVRAIRTILANRGFTVTV